MELLLILHLQFQQVSIKSPTYNQVEEPKTDETQHRGDSRR